MVGPELVKVYECDVPTGLGSVIVGIFLNKGKWNNS